ncbi:unnamed protein product [Ectocarpus sp. CCAP 1310/34]|nr:unnamed protein product [Ectocarpus sp. CCAP 1310/34]
MVDLASEPCLTSISGELNECLHRTVLWGLSLRRPRLLMTRCVTSYVQNRWG